MAASDSQGWYRVIWDPQESTFQAKSQNEIGPMIALHGRSSAKLILAAHLDSFFSVFLVEVAQMSQRGENINIVCYLYLALDIQEGKPLNDSKKYHFISNVFDTQVSLSRNVIQLTECVTACMREKKRENKMLCMFDSGRMVIQWCFFHNSSLLSGSFHESSNGMY